MIVRGFSDYPDWLSQKLMDGNFSAVCLAYRLPATFRYDDKVFIARDRAQLVRVLATYQAVLLHNGITSVSTRVSNAPNWMSKRFEVCVDQSFLFDGEADPQQCRMQFFVERVGLRPGIQMVQVDHLPFAHQIVRQRALRNLEVTVPSGINRSCPS